MKRPPLRSKPPPAFVPHHPQQPPLGYATQDATNDWPIEGRRQFFGPGSHDALIALRRLSDVSHDGKIPPDILEGIQVQIDSMLFSVYPNGIQVAIEPMNYLKIYHMIAAAFQYDVSLSEAQKTLFYYLFLGRRGHDLKHAIRMDTLKHVCGVVLQYPPGNSLLTLVADWAVSAARGLVTPADIIIKHFVDEYLGDEEFHEFILNIDIISPRFAAIFMAAAAPTSDISPLLIPFIGTWLKRSLDGIIQFLSENSAYGTAWVTVTLNNIMAYNCLKSTSTDAAHDILHASILAVIIKWTKADRSPQLNLPVLKTLNAIVSGTGALEATNVGLTEKQREQSVECVVLARRMFVELQ